MPSKSKKRNSFKSNPKPKPGLKPGPKPKSKSSKNPRKATTSIPKSDCYVCKTALCDHDSVTNCKKCNIAYHEDCVKKSFDCNIWSCPKCHSASLFPKTRKNNHMDLPMINPAKTSDTYRIVNVSITPMNNQLPLIKPQSLVREIQNPEDILKEYMNI